MRELDQYPPDLILSDHGLPGFDGFAALALAREHCPETPFIFVTGAMGEELAIDSLRGGATDYVLKTRISNLFPAVERALRLAEERITRRLAELELRDSEEQRRHEETLRTSEERFRLLVEGVEGYAIYMLDTHGRISTWNVGAERIMGYGAQEIIGRRFHRFYTAGDVQRKKPDQALAVATAAGHFQDERWQVRKDGTQYWAGFVLTALRDESGRLTGYSTIARDITQRKQAEDEIRRLNAELEHRVQERTAELQAAYQEMEAFSYSISHDLRAPLIHIAGFVEMLKSDLGPSLDEKSSRHLQTICDATENMGRMIADLLTFSRIGRAEMHKVRFNLTDTIKDVRRDLQSQTRNRKVAWIIPELPEVYGDPLMLRQALYNLLGNALKFTLRRNEARIEVTAETTDGEHILAIRDNGAGFDMKYAAKLFGVFQRLHSAREFEGTGIGLANVRRIIARHGGRTWAEGAVDRGATFYFTLPVVAPDIA
jgi:PAS domain S-box-containing protein